MIDVDDEMPAFAEVRDGTQVSTVVRPPAEDLED